MKRKDYITWDEYFMGIAMLAAKRSKDPNTQVGACIVSPDNIIISTGYNGMPTGCSDDVFPWCSFLGQGSPVGRQLVQFPFEPEDGAVLVEQRIVLRLGDAAAAGGDDKTALLSQFRQGF